MAKGRRRSRAVHTLSLVAAPAALAFGALAFGALAVVTVVVTPSLAATPPCTATAAQATAPPGMTIGPIDTLNPALPEVPTGALSVPADGDTPAYCLVTGSVVTNARTGKTTGFGLALPRAWNSKFLFSGCGGYCGIVFQTLPDDANGGGYPTNALARGYAIAATDDGHASDPLGLLFDGSWALTAPGVRDEEAVADFIYRAVHTVTDASKQFVRNWYSGALARSYYFGCSDGGREGMVEATHFPADFDGYIIGDPFFDVPGQILAGRAAKAVLNAPDAYIPPDLLKRVNDAVYANCDAVDGVEDGLIQNPGMCSFDPGSLLCAASDTAGCLTQNQVDTLTVWFSAAKDEQGRVVSYGFPVSDIYDERAPGNNLFRWAEAAGPPRDIDAADPWGTERTKQPAGWLFFDESLKYLVHLDPDFDSNNDSPVDERGVVSNDDMALLMTRTDAGSGDDPQELASFLESDRKMILYHGYSDGYINPFRTIRFYRNWAGLAGGYDALQQSVRLFMVPGMYHCSKGPGPNFFDALGALERWVETGVAPEAIVATKYRNDDRTQPVLRRMPLCAFPTQARYAGTGDVNGAGSWSCTANQDLLRVGPNGALAGLERPGP